MPSDQNASTLKVRQPTDFLKLVSPFTYIERHKGAKLAGVAGALAPPLFMPHPEFFFLHSTGRFLGVKLVLIYPKIPRPLHDLAPFGALAYLVMYECCMI